jgi:hypothetical protein
MKDWLHEELPRVETIVYRTKNGNACCLEIKPKFVRLFTSTGYEARIEHHRRTGQARDFDKVKTVINSARRGAVITFEQFKEEYEESLKAMSHTLSQIDLL